MGLKPPICYRFTCAVCISNHNMYALHMIRLPSSPKSISCTVGFIKNERDDLSAIKPLLTNRGQIGLKGTESTLATKGGCQTVPFMKMDAHTSADTSPSTRRNQATIPDRLQILCAPIQPQPPSSNKVNSMQFSPTLISNGTIQSILKLEEVTCESLIDISGWNMAFSKSALQVVVELDACGIEALHPGDHLGRVEKPHSHLCLIFIYSILWHQGCCGVAQCTESFAFCSCQTGNESIFGCFGTFIIVKVESVMYSHGICRIFGNSESQEGISSHTGGYNDMGSFSSCLMHIRWEAPAGRALYACS